MTPDVYLHSATKMPEIPTQTVKLMVGASVYLGNTADWSQYHDLYTMVYCHEGRRVLREDGVLIVIQTNAYEDGKFNCRYYHLLTLMMDYQWRLIDERVWERRAADHFQVPFSHVLVFVPPGGTAKRNDFNKRSNEWFQGIWRHKQTHGGELNAYPDTLCDMLVKACTVADDLIVDPFAGTGRLLGIAGRLGRRAVGYEINNELVSTLRRNGCEVHVGNETLRPIKTGLVE